MGSGSHLHEPFVDPDRYWLALVTMGDLIMRKRQPDTRIHKHELGSFTHRGKRFVVNLRPGVPRNACIEEFRKGGLRCWASHTWLDDKAADFVRTNATFNLDKNSFVWKNGVRVRETRRG